MSKETAAHARPMSGPPAREGPLSAAEALDVLRAGNRRWVTGQLQHPSQSIERRESLTRYQSPFAVIFSCIDSRVPPEMIFDRGLGDLLVVRSAGQTLDDVIVGSLEFGPCELRTPLIVVLGHRRCRAALAAVESFERDRWPEGHIEDIVEALRPAYKLAVTQPDGDLVDNIVTAHTLLTVARLKREKAFGELLRSDALAIVGGLYDLKTGVVDIIG